MKARNVKIFTNGEWGTGTGMASLKLDSHILVLQKDYERKNQFLMVLGDAPARIQESWARFVIQQEKNMELLGAQKDDWGMPDLVLDLFYDFYREERKADRAATA
jgi:hypothetical protein